ncbi:unnamed protein product, partial [Ectocarpus sp. 12 AP-2014]
TFSDLFPLPCPGRIRRNQVRTRVRVSWRQRETVRFAALAVWWESVLQQAADPGSQPDRQQAIPEEVVRRVCSRLRRFLLASHGRGTQRAALPLVPRGVLDGDGGCGADVLPSKPSMLLAEKKGGERGAGDCR